MRNNRGEQLFKKIVDILLLPVILIGAIIMKIYRTPSPSSLPYSTWLLKKFAVFPIIDHYYEPQFKFSAIERSGIQARSLSNVGFNLDDQEAFLGKLNFTEECVGLEQEIRLKYASNFQINNQSFESGDIEILYQFLRFQKPKRVIEIGGGVSSLIIQLALDKNKNDVPMSSHIVIEPYVKPWISGLKGIQIIEKKVEDIDLSYVDDLEKGDLLFIDSSHMVRPQGDVLKEYLEILPSLKKGVFIHIHDVFTPKLPPLLWLEERMRFWNEQYLVEAILANSSRYKVVLGLNFLKHSNFNLLHSKSPFLSVEREPGSLYLEVVE
jgi:hypothetical protein